MKKTFPFTDGAHKPARVVESIKSEVRKYLKRERRKPLPEATDFWDFACKAGASPESAEPVHVAELNKQIDLAVATGWESVYLEIIAKPGHRATKEEPELTENT